MGTWDAGSFDNDTACDWSYELEKASDLSFIEQTLDAVLMIPAGTTIDAELGERAVAAAEVLARLLGNWGEESSYTETADNWVRAHPLRPPRALVDKAVAALQRLQTSESELLELWEESEAAGWIAAVEELRARLTGV